MKEGSVPSWRVATKLPRRLRDLSLKFKLIIAFLGVALLGCVSAGAGIYFIRMISGHVTEVVGTAAPLMKNARELTQSLDQVQLLGTKLLEFDEADKVTEVARDIDRYDAEFGKTLNRIEELADRHGLTFDVASQPAGVPATNARNVEKKDTPTAKNQSRGPIQLAREKQSELATRTRQMIEAHLRAVKERASAAETFREFTVQAEALDKVLSRVVRTCETNFASNEETAKTRVQAGTASPEDLSAIIEAFYEHDYPVVSGINAASLNILDARYIARTYLSEKDPKKLREIERLFERKVKATESLLSHVRRRIGSKAIEQGLAKTIASLTKLKELVVGNQGVFAAHRRAVEADESLTTNRRKLAEASRLCRQAIDGIAHEADNISGKFLAKTGDVAGSAAKWEWSFLAIAGSGLGVSILLGALFAITLSRPLRRLADQAGAISKGDLKVEIEEDDRLDELGALTNAFRLMLENLRDQIRQTIEGIGVLSASASEIAQASSAVATSMSQATTALAETSATSDQVRQAASLSNEKARRVAQESQQAVEASHSGLQATEVTVKQMKMVKDQMESIGGTVVQLSEQSKAIEGIIDAVQDLAGQSNLLAVNASIEAARAAEHGKGFAVVAHEIKTLADQSKEATSQINAILQDTRKLIGAVVMATEQGNKSVEAGVEQSILAGESIHVLTRHVEGSAQAASVIEASSQQQLTGVEQVSKAVMSIEESMKQNLESSEQLKSAGEQLDFLAGTLKELVVRFSV